MPTSIFIETAETETTIASQRTAGNHRPGQLCHIVVIFVGCPEGKQHLLRYKSKCCQKGV